MRRLIAAGTENYSRTVVVKAIQPYVSYSQGSNPVACGSLIMLEKITPTTGKFLNIDEYIKNL